MQEARAVGHDAQDAARPLGAARADAREVAEVDEAVGDARADEPRDGSPEGEVEHAPHVEAAAARLARAERDPQGQPGGDEEAIGVHAHLARPDVQRDENGAHRFPGADLRRTTATVSSAAG